jgi:maltooligosyltrehalose trehalohydrolase
MVESDENSPTYVRPRPEGVGLEGVWSDDFHHALHAIATDEREGYYQDFGGVEKLARALNEGFVFQGEEFKFWGRPRGESSKGMPLEAHVICIQNHDQVGNRALGERLTSLVPVAMRKIMAAILLLAPETPLLFMGQESDEPSPFQFFTDFGDPGLRKAVSEGRRKEFNGFSSFGNGFPDPQDPATYERSHLTWDLTPERREMLEWYRDLLRLRAAVYSGSERTCRAGSLGEAGIELQVPAREPKVVLRASWKGNPPSDRREDWEQVVSLKEAEYSLEIRASAEVVAKTGKSVVPAGLEHAVGSVLGTDRARLLANAPTALKHAKKL